MQNNIQTKQELIISTTCFQQYTRLDFNTGILKEDVTLIRI